MTFDDDYSDVMDPGASADALLLHLRQLGDGPIPTPSPELEEVFDLGVPFTRAVPRRRRLLLLTSAAIVFAATVTPAAAGALPRPAKDLVSTVIRDITRIPTTTRRTPPTNVPPTNVLHVPAPSEDGANTLPDDSTVPNSTDSSKASAENDGSSRSDDVGEGPFSNPSRAGGSQFANRVATPGEDAPSDG
jgi:hypothetical protein